MWKMGWQRDVTQGRNAGKRRSCLPNGGETSEGSETTHKEGMSNFQLVNGMVNKPGEGLINVRDNSEHETYRLPSRRQRGSCVRQSLLQPKFRGERQAQIFRHTVGTVKCLSTEKMRTPVYNTWLSTLCGGGENKNTQRSRLAKVF